MRVELLDGALLMTPPPGIPHRRLSRNVTWRLASAAPLGMEVFEGVGVRMHPGRILTPDITVVTRPGEDGVLWDATDVAMVVEITSPGSVAADRVATAFVLEAGRYVPVARSEVGQLLALGEPFPVTLDLEELARATRPGT